MIGMHLDTTATVREAVASAPLIDNVPGVHLLELGDGWDALRAPATLGSLALARLREEDEQLGPVLYDAPGQQLYFALPLGSGAYWHTLPVRLLSAGSWLVVPDPYRAEVWFGGWCELPEDGTLTDPDALCRALQPRDRGKARAGA